MVLAVEQGIQGIQGIVGNDGQIGLAAIVNRK
jgi:hypothetical protein